MIKAWLEASRVVFVLGHHFRIRFHGMAKMIKKTTITDKNKKKEQIEGNFFTRQWAGSCDEKKSSHFGSPELRNSGPRDERFLSYSGHGVRMGDLLSSGGFSSSRDFFLSAVAARNDALKFMHLASRPPPPPLPTAPQLPSPEFGLTKSGVRSVDSTKSGKSDLQVITFKENRDITENTVHSEKMKRRANEESL